MNLFGIIGFFNHPVTQGVIDVCQYAYKKHIGPAMQAANKPPTDDEVRSTVSEYATDVYDVEPISETFKDQPAGSDAPTL